MDASDQTMAAAAGLEEFRREARLWIRANLEPKTEASVRVAPRTETKTAEEIAENRQRQRQLYEGGFAGISFPKEYGGRGLTHEHERVFKEESARYVTPDLGGAYAMTLGPIARSMMAHGSEEMCRATSPKCWQPTRSGVSSIPNPKPVRTWRGSAPWRFVTESSGSSTVRKSGQPVPTIRTGPCAWRDRLERPKASRPDLVRHPDVGQRCDHPSNSADRRQRRVLPILDDVVVPAEQVFGSVNDGWTVAQTMLVYERGGGRP